MTRVRSRACRAGILPLVLAASMAALPAARAQDTNLPQAPNMPAPHTTVLEKVDPPLQSDHGETTGSLSETLNRSEGVITPPAGVDPLIRKPAPVAGAGRMPVIPPPGEPGGNPEVQPR